MASPVQLIFGAASIGDSSDVQAKFNTVEAVRELVELFIKHGYNRVDTARGYSPGAFGSSERILGEAGIGQLAVIDTKVKSFSPGTHSKETIRQSVVDSLSALKVSQVNVEYLHAPDRTIPFEETCEAMNGAYKAGHFKQFGLSNYTAQEVEQIISICDKNGWVRPSVYQGHYNAIARHNEDELFPVLRRHGIAFYAYSPTAGGFFSGKVTRDAVNRQGSRWDNETMLGRMYTSIYHKDDLFDASDRVQAAAKDAGITGHAAALRWLIHHSELQADKGDAVILGASSLQQLSENISIAEAGPLPDALVKAVNDVWSVVKDVAPSYHM